MKNPSAQEECDCSVLSIEVNQVLFHARGEKFMFIKVFVEEETGDNDEPRIHLRAQGAI